MSHPLDRYRPTADVLAPSVLDRLIDADPDLAEDPPRPIGEQVRSLRECLRRDLEILLNTRRRPVSPPSHLGDLADALVSYGVDGFFTTALVTEEQRSAFAAALERRIRLFEPRLAGLSVAVLPRRLPSERSLRLRIEASYAGQSGLPPMRFESAVDPSTQRISVEASGG